MSLTPCAMSKPRPDRGETEDFAAVRPPEELRERKEFELIGHYRLTVREDFRRPIELRLGRDERSPICYLVPYTRWSFAVIQPETHQADASRGLATTEGHSAYIALGREASPELALGPDVSRRHCLVAEHDSDEHGRTLEIENYGRNGTRILVDPRDVLIDPVPFEPIDTWPDDTG